MKITEKDIGKDFYSFCNRKENRLYCSTIVSVTPKTIKTLHGWVVKQSDIIAVGTEKEMNIFARKVAKLRNEAPKIASKWLTAEIEKLSEELCN